MMAGEKCGKWPSKRKEKQYCTLQFTSSLPVFLMKSAMFSCWMHLETTKLCWTLEALLWLLWHGFHCNVKKVVSRLGCTTTYFLVESVVRRNAKFCFLSLCTRYCFRPAFHPCRQCGMCTMRTHFTSVCFHPCWVNEYALRTKLLYNQKRKQMISWTQSCFEYGLKLCCGGSFLIHLQTHSSGGLTFPCSLFFGKSFVSKLPFSWAGSVFVNNTCFMAMFLWPGPTIPAKSSEGSWQLNIPLFYVYLSAMKVPILIQCDLLIAPALIFCLELSYCQQTH